MTSTDHYKAAIEAAAKKNFMKIHKSEGDSPWEVLTQDTKDYYCTLVEPDIQAFLAALPNEVDEDAVLRDIAQVLCELNGYAPFEKSFETVFGKEVTALEGHLSPAKSVMAMLYPYTALLAKVTATVREKDAEIARLREGLPVLHSALTQARGALVFCNLNRRTVDYHAYEGKIRVAQEEITKGFEALASGTAGKEE